MSADEQQLFDELLALELDKRRAPVETWHPANVRRIDMRIARDGTWHYLGSPINRQSMVNLFATVLRKDEDGYCLVTPGEKLLITVDDAPFVAVSMTRKGDGADQELLFTTNVGDHVRADEDHPITVALGAEPSPYVLVRSGMPALIARAVYYQLVDAGFARGGEWCVRSGGQEFALGKVG